MHQLIEAMAQCGESQRGVLSDPQAGIAESARERTYGVRPELEQPGIKLDATCFHPEDVLVAGDKMGGMPPSSWMIASASLAPSGVA